MTTRATNAGLTSTSGMEQILPTLSSPTWSITSFRDSLSEVLPNDTGGTHLRMLFYAATLRGWNGIRQPVEKWLSQKGRTCTAYIGTDHGITDPDALVEMQKAVSVRLLIEYKGIYHPKVVWCEGADHTLWIGSNNLTEGGLRQNIECAVFLRSPEIPQSFADWFKAIEIASVPFDPSLVSSYRDERDEFTKSHGTGGAFTWSKRREPPKPPSPPPSGPKTNANKNDDDREPSGRLVVQVMPRETGPGGKQLQFPIRSVARFFGLSPSIGASATVRLRSLATGDTKRLTMTVYGNSTVRLSISELDYSDRPCVIVFSRAGAGTYEFEIVQRAVSPDRYKRLIAACNSPTRTGSRRWVIT